MDSFEQDITTYLATGVQAAALNSGTAALHLALILLELKARDELRCQSMLFSALANSIAYKGAAIKI